MELTFTQASAEDAAELSELFIRYSHELENYEMAYTLDEVSVSASMAGRIRSRLSLAAIAKDGEKIAAFLFCNISRLSGYSYGGSPLFGYISDAYVLPEYRGCGAAHALCEMAEQWLRENEVGYVELKVLESNSRAHEFWSHCGFEPTTRVYGKKI